MKDEIHPDVAVLRQLARAPVTETFQPSQPIPFPLEALPPVIRNFVQEAARSLPAPVDLLAVPALVCASAAIGGSRAIQLKEGWIERPALYAAIIAPPGTMKSPALNLVTRPIRARQSLYKEDFTKAMEGYQSERHVYERDLANFTKLKRVDLPPEPTEPILKRTYTGDITIERLAGLLSENPRGILIPRDELMAWVKSMNQYKGGKGADREFFLSVWGGSPIIVDRQGKKPIAVDNPFVSVVGCIPPDMLADLEGDEHHREDGFIHRLLLSYPDPVQVRWTEWTISERSQQAYKASFDRLYELEPASLSPMTPVALPLTKEAKSFWVDWHDHHCVEAESQEDDFGLRGAYAKYKGYCARLALVHAVWSDPECTAISKESIAAGADFTEYFKSHAAKALPISRQTRKNPEDHCEEWIIKKIRDSRNAFRSYSKRDLQQNSHFTTSVFNKAFKSLLDVGRIEEKQVLGTKKKIIMLTDEA